MSAGFTERRYKAFFLRRVRLADNAVKILLKADIINSTCNTCWTLDFNINSEVREEPFTGRTHFDLLSLNEHRKLQIFLNYSLHRDHDSSDPDILSVITLFKVIINSSVSLKLSFIMQTTSAKQIKKSVFDTLVKLNTSVKKTLIIITPKLSVYTDSSFTHFSLIILLKSDSVKEEDELTQLSEEDVSSEFTELKDLHDQIKLLKLKKLQLAQYTDEKVSLLTLMTAWLNETLLLQGQNIISADEFLKQLLSELFIQTDLHLLSKIISWRNDYKIIILNHWALHDQIWSAVNHFSLMKVCIFTHMITHQAKVTQWAETEDLNQVSESGNDWKKYLTLSSTVEDTVICSVEKEPVSWKCL